MKKIKLLIILLIPILLITGCNSSEKVQINKAIKKTSITKKGLNSYKCKVHIINKKDNINYTVLNEKNKNYSIAVSTKDNNYSYSIEDGNISVPLDEGMIVNPNYQDTDKYLNSLNGIYDIKMSKEILDKDEYKKYTFKIKKYDLNKVLEDFSIKVKNDGIGYTYIDKNNHIYIINYSSGVVSINITYTRLNNVK